MIIVPWVRDTFRPYYGGNGLSLFSAALLLGIMILPTIISISESAIRAVRINIIKVHWHLVLHMKEAYFEQWYQPQNPVSWQVLY